jgi:protein TonB
MGTLDYHIGDFKKEKKPNESALNFIQKLKKEKVKDQSKVIMANENSGLTLAIYDNMLAAKRNRHANDDSNRALFLAIGLTLSLVLVIIAMEWKFYGNNGLTIINATDLNTFEEVIDIPNTLQPPPPPPANNMALIFNEVDNEVILEELKVRVDVEMSEATVLKAVVYEPVQFEIEDEKAEEIFTIVEQKPEPVGGMSAFYKFVSENIDYPAAAKRANIKGKVYVRFVVSKTGKISNVEVLKGIGGGCDEEAVRVIENAPDWIPGRQRGKPVTVYMSVPIIFTLRE